MKLTPEDWAPYAARAALADQAGHTTGPRPTSTRPSASGPRRPRSSRRPSGSSARATQPADWVRVATLLTTAAKDPTPPDRGPLPPGRRLSEGRGSQPATGPRAPGSRGGCRRRGRRWIWATRSSRRRRSPSGRVPPTTGPSRSRWADRILARIAEREAADPSAKERNKPLRHLFLHLRGALLVRAGRPEEAAAALRDPTALHPLDSEFANWVFLALAEHRLGRADAAKEAAAKARAAQAKPSPTRAGRGPRSSCWPRNWTPPCRRRESEGGVPSSGAHGGWPGGRAGFGTRACLRARHLEPPLARTK